MSPTGVFACGCHILSLAFARYHMPSGILRA